MSKSNRKWFQLYKERTRPEYLLDLARDQGRLKRANEDIHGVNLRAKLLSLRPKEMPLCEAALPATNCHGERAAMHVHHTRGRGRYLNDTATFMAVCQHCHTHIESNREWAMKHGYLESRHDPVTARSSEGMNE